MVRVAAASGITWMPSLRASGRSVRVSVDWISGPPSSLSARLPNRQSRHTWSAYSRENLERAMRLRTIIEFILIIEISKLFEVDLVTEDRADTTEAFDELVSFAGFVGHEL